MNVSNFCFMDFLKMLQNKGYELRLYPGERDKFHIQLTDWDRDTGCVFNVKEVVALSSIEQCRSGPDYALANVFLRLMERLDSQAECFDRYKKGVGDSNDNET